MKYSIKEMIEYGYEWTGVIPVTHMEAIGAWINDQPVLILYPDNSEAYIHSEKEFDLHKDTVMYGLERSDTEIKLINNAIAVLKDLVDKLYYDAEGNENKNRPNDIMDCGMIDGEWNSWKRVLHLLDFTTEDIRAVVGDFYEEWQCGESI